MLNLLVNLMNLLANLVNLLVNLKWRLSTCSERLSKGGRKLSVRKGKGARQKTTEEQTSRRSSVKRKEINIEISMESISISLFYVVNETEKSLPAYSAEASAVWVARPPDEDRLAHDVVFGHEAPVA